MVSDFSINSSDLTLIDIIYLKNNHLHNFLLKIMIFKNTKQILN